MNLQIGIFGALIIVEFYIIRIDIKLERIIYMLKELKNKEE